MDKKEEEVEPNKIKKYKSEEERDNHENDCRGGSRDFEGEARDLPHPLVPIAINLFSLPSGCNTCQNALPGESCPVA